MPCHRHSGPYLMWLAHLFMIAVMLCTINLELTAVRRGPCCCGAGARRSALLAATLSLRYRWNQKHATLDGEGGNLALALAALHSSGSIQEAPHPPPPRCRPAVLYLPREKPHWPHRAAVNLPALGYWPGSPSDPAVAQSSTTRRKGSPIHPHLGQSAAGCQTRTNSIPAIHPEHT